MRGDAGRGRNLKFSCAGSESRDTGEEGGARNLWAPGYYKHAAALVLVAVIARAWQRPPVQEFGRDRGRWAHRAATAASGFAVTGAPACWSGATKL
jgi:hypothetical protein